MALTEGTIIGNYVIEAAIARGGMAMIYMARHRILESTHAIKVLDEKLAQSADIRRRFLSEGKIQACYRHPHITPVTDVIAEPGVAGLVMPFLAGEDLGSRLERIGKLKLAQAVQWSQQVLSALAFVHSQGIVHRDLKPGNLFLETLPDEEDRIRLMDFGIAKVKDQPKSWTRTRAGVMGTPSYMSPEQVRSPAQVDYRSDLFVLGAVLYEMLTGKMAFSAESDYDTQTLIVQGQLTPIDEHLPDIPRPLVEILDKAMAPDRADRFSSARSFSAALQLAMQFPGGVSERPRSRRETAPAPSAHQAAAKEAAAKEAAAKEAAERGAEARAAAEREAEARAARERIVKRRAAMRAEREAAQRKRDETRRAMEQARLQSEQHRQRQQRPQVQKPARPTGPVPVKAGGQVMEMLPMEPGTFIMGGPGEEHPVTLTRPFLLAKRPVIQAMWTAVTGEDIGSFDGYGLPVEGVSWFEVILFCNQLSRKERRKPAYEIGPGRTPDITWDPEAGGYRLPTEAEWEYAARAGQASFFAGGDVAERVGWFFENSKDAPQRVGMKLPNAWGLQDMSGNVHEWVWDRGGAYPTTQQTDPTGPRHGVARVLRGGGWRSIAESTPLTERIAEWPSKSRDDLGFRLARNVD